MIRTIVGVAVLLAVGAVAGIAVGGWLRDTPKSSTPMVVQDQRPAQAIALVRQTLAARIVGNTLDCLHYHTKFSNSSWDAAMNPDGSVKVRHSINTGVATTGGVYEWRVFVAERLIDPVQRPTEQFC